MLIAFATVAAALCFHGQPPPIPSRRAHVHATVLVRHARPHELQPPSSSMFEELSHLCADCLFSPAAERERQMLAREMVHV